MAILLKENRVKYHLINLSEIVQKLSYKMKAKHQISVVHVANIADNVLRSIAAFVSVVRRGMKSLGLFLFCSRVQRRTLQ